AARLSGPAEERGHGRGALPPRPDRLHALLRRLLGQSRALQRSGSLRRCEGGLAAPLPLPPRRRGTNRDSRLQLRGLRLAPDSRAHLWSLAAQRKKLAPFPHEEHEFQTDRPAVTEEVCGWLESRL